VIDLSASPAAAAAPTDEATLLETRSLTVAFPSPRGTIYAANEVSFEIARGQTLGLVGESGSGKTVTLRALIGLVPPPGWVVDGQIVFDGRDLVQMPRGELRSVRARDIGMIFQDPTVSLNPVLSIGDQLSETLRVNAGLKRAAATSRAEELLERVGIRPARARLRAYPHEISGGMAQRVMIALAICANPRLLLADEPTTALDVSVQDQILSLLEDLRLEKGMSMLIVSHDLGVIARACDNVAVMYAGRILERGTVDEVLRQPRHPYTRMLLATIPRLQPNAERRLLVTISGQLPDLASTARGCPFEPRCEYRRPDCAAVPMVVDAPGRAHGSACPFV
jgi:peptide/nickel transport system ATP-binding protein